MKPSIAERIAFLSKWCGEQEMRPVPADMISGPRIMREREMMRAVLATLSQREAREAVVRAALLEIRDDMCADPADAANRASSIAARALAALDAAETDAPAPAAGIADRGLR